MLSVRRVFDFEFGSAFESGHVRSERSKQGRRDYYGIIASIIERKTVLRMMCLDDDKGTWSAVLDAVNAG